MSSNKLLVLLTGGNQGLGYYAATQLSLTGKYHILLGSRDLQKAHAAIEKMKTDDSSPANIANIEPIQIDMSSDDSITAAAKTVEQKFGHLDILMLNAGVAYVGDKIPKREQFKQIYDTNVFGTAATVDAFLPLLRKSSQPGGKRIAFTGSRTASLELSLKSEGGMAANSYNIYRSSKSALNMVMAGYARELEAEGFVVGASCPGYCGTNLNGYSGLRDPREGAKDIVKAMEGSKEEVHGKLVGDVGVIPW